MNFYVMTLFPEMILQGVNTSITGRGIKAGAISVEAFHIRDYTKDKHGKTEDAPYGGGVGLVMQAQPIWDCYQAVLDHIREKPGKQPRLLYMSPQGKTFTQQMAEELSREEDLIFLCGHYEGVDERVLELMGAEEVSIGDYILTGGELPAMVMIDSISRLVPGVLGKLESAEVETFYDNLLEYPQYSRPETFMGLTVPEVLLSGHHANVDRWRRERSIERTWHRRPELLENAVLSKKEQKFLEELKAAERERTAREEEAPESAEN